LEYGIDRITSRDAQREDQNSDAAIYKYGDFSIRSQPQS
jgi:hypothetical protein